MSRTAVSWATRARMELELRRRRESRQGKTLQEEYGHDPEGYIRHRLGWNPWAGTPGHPGQVEVIEAYRLAVAQQRERKAWESGNLGDADLVEWKPGDVIQNWIRVEAGHTVGKTKLAAGIVSHFFDCMVPSIGYLFAPGHEQIDDLLFKEIRRDREGRGLPGRVYDGQPMMTRSADHFVKGRATNNAKGTGTERTQGQHGPHLLFVLDEAEGIPDFVWEAIDAMTGGGLVIVLMLANPRTRTSTFHKVRLRPEVVSFRMSCTHHPNVLTGREVVPEAVRRDWVETRIERHCQVVDAHDEAKQTFELPYPVRTSGGVHPPGTIFEPDTEFMFRVLGVAPGNSAHNTLVPVGRYEAAKTREVGTGDITRVRIGVDVARFGDDFGTVWVRWGARVWRHARMTKADTNVYARSIKALALDLAKKGATDLEIRIDGGGGFGGGVVDKVKPDVDLARPFDSVKVYEVHFNGVPYDEDAHDDLITELYAETAESLKGLRIVDAPAYLEPDLCERTYRWVNKRGKDVRQLQPKDKFRKDHNGRSPDDGDGFVLAVAPDFCFTVGVGDIDTLEMRLY